jgi:D-glycero-alpha-D-manno-heptose-7-phosphate kinase
MLLFVAPEQQTDVRTALSDLIYVPFKFENSGSHVIYYQP